MQVLIHTTLKKEINGTDIYLRQISRRKCQCPSTATERFTYVNYVAPNFITDAINVFKRVAGITGLVVMAGQN